MKVSINIESSLHLLQACKSLQRDHNARYAGTDLAGQAKVVGSHVSLRTILVADLHKPPTVSRRPIAAITHFPLSYLLATSPSQLRAAACADHRLADSATTAGLSQRSLISLYRTSLPPALLSSGQQRVQTTDSQIAQLQPAYRGNHSFPSIVPPCHQPFSAQGSSVCRPQTRR
ncbi:hypothetical protein J6590_002484 [Homalodisca vitripennis]|nr:hypothetical protein J6590_002484 [Homalodisca vitripennis]